MLGVPPPPQPWWQFSRAAAKGPASPRCPSPSFEVELKARGVCPSFPNRNYPGQGCQACCLLQTPPDLSCLHGCPEVPALGLTHAVPGCPRQPSLTGGHKPVAGFPLPVQAQAGGKRGERLGTAWSNKLLPDLSEDPPRSRETPFP